MNRTDILRKLEILDLLVTGAREKSLALESSVVDLFLFDTMSGQEYADIMDIYPRLRDAQRFIDHAIRQEKDRIATRSTSPEDVEEHSGISRPIVRIDTGRSGSSHAEADPDAPEIQSRTGIVRGIDQRYIEN